MKNIRIFPSDFFHFWVVNFSVYLNRHVFVMDRNICLVVASVNKEMLYNFCENVACKYCSVVSF